MKKTSNTVAQRTPPTPNTTAPSRKAPTAPERLSIFSRKAVKTAIAERIIPAPIWRRSKRFS
jgi:hypothetical protein